jgi:hypothetical protein
VYVCVSIVTLFRSRVVAAHETMCGRAIIRCEVCFQPHDLPAAEMDRHLQDISQYALRRHALSKMVRVATPPEASAQSAAQLTSLHPLHRGIKRGRESEADEEHKSSGADASPAPAASSSSSSLLSNPTLTLGLASTLHTPSAATASSSSAMDESVDFDPAPAAASSSSAIHATAAVVVASSSAVTSSGRSSLLPTSASLDSFRSSLFVGSLVDVCMDRVSGVERFDLGEVTKIDFDNATVAVAVGGRSLTE